MLGGPVSFLAQRTSKSVGLCVADNELRPRRVWSSSDLRHPCLRGNEHIPPTSRYLRTTDSSQSLAPRPEGETGWLCRLLEPWLQASGRTRPGPGEGGSRNNRWLRQSCCVPRTCSLGVPGAGLPSRGDRRAVPACLRQQVPPLKGRDCSGLSPENVIMPGTSPSSQGSACVYLYVLASFRSACPRC